MEHGALRNVLPRVAEMLTRNVMTIATGNDEAQSGIAKLMAAMK